MANRQDIEYIRYEPDADNLSVCPPIDLKRIVSTVTTDADISTVKKFVDTADFSNQKIDSADIAAGRHGQTTIMIKKSGQGVCITSTLEESQKSFTAIPKTPEKWPDNPPSVTPVYALGVVMMDKSGLKLEDLYLVLKRLQRGQQVFYEPEVQPWLVWQPTGAFFQYFENLRQEAEEEKERESKRLTATGSMAEGVVDEDEAMDEEEEEDVGWGRRGGKVSGGKIGGGKIGGGGKVGTMKRPREEDDEEDEDEEDDSDDEISMQRSRGGKGIGRAGKGAKRVGGKESFPPSSVKQSESTQQKSEKSSQVNNQTASNSAPARGGVHHTSSLPHLALKLQPFYVRSYLGLSQNIKLTVKAPLTLCIRADGIIYVKGPRTLPALQRAFAAVYPFLTRFGFGPQTSVQAYLMAANAQLHNQQLQQQQQQLASQNAAMMQNSSQMNKAGLPPMMQGGVNPGQLLHPNSKALNQPPLVNNASMRPNPSATSSSLSSHIPNPHLRAIPMPNTHASSLRISPASQVSPPLPPHQPVANAPPNMQHHHLQQPTSLGSFAANMTAAAQPRPGQAPFMPHAMAQGGSLGVASTALGLSGLPTTVPPNSSVPYSVMPSSAMTSTVLTNQMMQQQNASWQQQANNRVNPAAQPQPNQKYPNYK
eukprot:GDKJ01027762.1.p1 GENE.GDKJ01027762.1~~GDKJ01027762.1.p1  ORF type:complete len:704 (+),score=189.28 GDKJ01027762.1:164-2113(+)